MPYKEEGVSEITRVAILASGDRQSGGGGSTAERVVRDVLEGKVGFTVGVVICNNAPNEVGVYAKIAALNREFGLKGDNKVEVVHIGPRTHPEGKQGRGQTRAESAAICRVMERYGIDFIAALGYLRIISGELLEEWGWHPSYGQSDPLHNGIYHPKARISNDHPAILPFTAGTHGRGSHEEVIELFRSGRLKHTAMTYHLVSAGVDSGPVLFEEPVPILPEDDAASLGSRVQGVEKKLTSRVLERHLILRGEHVRGNL